LTNPHRLTQARFALRSLKPARGIRHKRVKWEANYPLTRTTTICLKMNR
jgi:hypothetical protein